MLNCSDQIEIDDWDDLSNHPTHERLRQSIGRDIRGHLLATLPDYMVPDAIIVLNSLPRNANGKLAREALPLPSGRRLDRSHDYVPPRNAVELTLVNLWEEALELTPIGVHDDFLRLGGNSLTALRLVARMRALFSCNIDLSALFTRRTIADIAADLRGGDGVRSSLLVPLAGRGRSGTATYCLHAAGGSVVCYAELARLLTSNGPVIGIQARGLSESPSHSVDEMAEAYAGLILNEDQSNSCVLLGWSFGGLLALEVARRLREAGRSVDFLGLIDTGFGRSGSELRALHQTVREHLSSEYGVKVAPATTSGDLSATELVAAIKAVANVPLGVGAEEIDRIAATLLANLDAMAAYRARDPYDGRVTYFRASSSVDNIESDWPAFFSRKPAIVEIAGDHFSLLAPPNVGNLAEQIKREQAVGNVIGAEFGHHRAAESWEVRADAAQVGA